MTSSLGQALFAGHLQRLPLSTDLVMESAECSSPLSLTYLKYLCKMTTLEERLRYLFFMSPISLSPTLKTYLPFPSAPSWYHTTNTFVIKS